MSQNSMRFLPAAIVLACGAALAQSEAEKQSDLAREHFRAVRERYESAEWVRGATREGIPLASLALEGWRGEELRVESGAMSRAFAPTEEGALPAFVVEAKVEDDAAAAHELVVAWLAGVSSDRRMQGLREWGLALGDVGFVGPSGATPGAVAWLAFARGNVAVRVLAIDQARAPVDVAAVAQAIDEAILARPALPTGAAPRKPELARFAAAQPAVVAGARVPLDVDVTDAYGGHPHVQWIVGGPGQGYVETDEHGRYVLHTTGPGKITLTLAVTGSTGTYTARSIEIAVADD